MKTLKIYIPLVIAAALTDGALFLAGVNPAIATLSFFGVIALGVFLKSLRS